MHIVVLDGFTLNPGDLDWSPLKALAPCTIYDRTPPEHLLERAAGAEILLTNKTPLRREHLEKLPAARYIGVLATGYNVVDVEAAQAHNIAVTNVPDYGTNAVAQLTFALLLELTHHAGHHAATVREGKWTHSVDFCYWDFSLVEVHGATMGLIGFGRIGQAVAKIAQAFGMQVLVYTRTPPPTLPPGVKQAELETIFRESDFVSLHCPLTPETKHLINAQRLALMKPSAFLINTSRGPIVEEHALAEALQRGVIAGAALDVLSVEPPPATNPLLTAPRCLITPHLAWATRAARARLLQVAVDNVKGFLNGKPQNLVR